MTKFTIHLSLSLKGMVRNGDEESIATMFLVPSEIAHFSDVKRLVDEEPFQVQTENNAVFLLISVPSKMKHLNRCQQLPAPYKRPYPRRKQKRQTDF